MPPKLTGQTLKALLQQGKFDEARRLVRQSDHAQKDAFLARIDQVEARQSAPATAKKKKKARAKRGPAQIVVALLMGVLFIPAAAVALFAISVFDTTPRPIERTYSAIPPRGQSAFEDYMAENYSGETYEVVTISEGSLERYFDALPAEQAEFERPITPDAASVWCLRVAPPLGPADRPTERFTLAYDRDAWRVVEPWENPTHRTLWEGMCGDW